MARRPNILCKLTKGKVVDAHLGFVDTFNWIVDFIGNLKGDGDVGNGSIRIDGAETGFPVIRDRGSAGNSVPGNFEPVFEYVHPEEETTSEEEEESGGEICLSSVGEGFYPVGRQFYSAVSVDSSAQIAVGCIWLEVTYPSSSSSSPSAVVKGGESFPVDDSGAVTDSKSWMPLYRIDNGTIAVDFRSAMSLTLREL